MANSEKSNAATADIEGQIDQIRSDIAELTRLIRVLAETRVSEARSAAEAEAEHLMAQTRGMAATLQGKAREADEALENHIKEKPLQSALFALVIGVLLGAMSRR